jgi:cation-transporting ATPase 13A2
VKSILFPKPTKFKFYSDSLKFVAVMACLAIFGMFATLPSSIKYQSPGEIVKRFLDLITITVPPALPAAMTIGVVLALGWLRKERIFCISPPRMNVAGRVSIMVFDKTGTLTENGLSVRGFWSVVHDGQRTVFAEFTSDVTDLECGNNEGQKFFEAMTTCHSVTQVND